MSLDEGLDATVQAYPPHPARSVLLLALSDNVSEAERAVAFTGSSSDVRRSRTRASRPQRRRPLQAGRPLSAQREVAVDREGARAGTKAGGIRQAEPVCLCSRPLSRPGT